MFGYAKDVARHVVEADVLRSVDGKLDIVDFWAPWCVPCKTMLPMYEKLARKYEYKVDFYKINVDDEPEFAQMFGVRSVPTIIFFKNGKKVDLFVGAISEQKLDSEIVKNI